MRPAAVSGKKNRPVRGGQGRRCGDDHSSRARWDCLTGPLAPGDGAWTMPPMALTGREFGHSDCRPPLATVPDDRIRRGIPPPAAKSQRPAFPGTQDPGSASPGGCGSSQRAASAGAPRLAIAVTRCRGYGSSRSRQGSAARPWPEQSPAAKINGSNNVLIGVGARPLHGDIPDPGCWNLLKQSSGQNPRDCSGAPGISAISQGTEPFLPPPEPAAKRGLISGHTPSPPLTAVKIAYTVKYGGPELTSTA